MATVQRTTVDPIIIPTIPHAITTTIPIPLL